LRPAPATARELLFLRPMATEGTLSRVWDPHVGAEFPAKSADDAVATTTAESYAKLIPLMVGARERNEVRDFYLPGIEIVAISWTVRQDRADPYGLASAPASLRPEDA